MSTLHKIISIIPARGGSKGLKNKNIINLANLPLIAHTINSSVQSNLVDQTIVTSDSEDILDVAEQFGALVVHRPVELAQDGTSMDPVIEHIINKYEKSTLEKSTTIILLQPTSPCRNSYHIKEAYNIFLENEGNPVYSVYVSDVVPEKAFKVDDNGYLTGAYCSDCPFEARQSFSKTYFANGAIYIFSLGDFYKNNNKIPRNNIIPYIMTKEDSIDIDSIEDLKKAEERLYETKNN